MKTVSIHATLAGGDAKDVQTDSHQRSFYPRHPRGWRHFDKYKAEVAAKVSIHATLAGGDDGVTGIPTAQLQVSIHATLAGGDIKKDYLKMRNYSFYPRHPRGWRHPNHSTALTPGTVSIHATLAVGDSECSFCLSGINPFLSTPPSRVATSAAPCHPARSARFYPRHPRGWRHWRCRSISVAPPMFLSTPPSRVATRPAEGGEGVCGCFYPRHPRGWRPKIPCMATSGALFLSTPPSRVATCVLIL